MMTRDSVVSVRSWTGVKSKLSHSSSVRSSLSSLRSASCNSECSPGLVRNHVSLTSNSRRQKRNHDRNFVKELRSLLRWRNRNLLALTQTFLPALVSGVLMQRGLNKQELNLPLIQHRKGCVASVHCNGFVELTTELQHHQNGANMLARCIHRFYTLAIEIISAYRGDIMHFHANTMIVFFEAVDDFEVFKHACGSLSCRHTPLELACIRVAACCYELHKHLDHLDVGEDGGHLTLHIGVGSGAMTVLSMQGSPSTESATANKCAVAGPSLEQARQAEQLAGPCETVFSPQAWQHVARTAVEGAPVVQQCEFHRFAAFDIRLHNYPMVRHAALQCQACHADSHPSRRIGSRAALLYLSLLMNFLPDSVLRHLGAGTLSHANELRTLSVAFVCIQGLDPLAADGPDTISRVFTELQRIAFAEEGYLHMLMIGEHGLLLQFAFGMPPLVHSDDALRACRACSRMTHIAAKQFQLTGKAGLATGRVFCGLVGSDRRQEYSIVGKSVQLAMRLTDAAGTSEVLVDQLTHESCQAELSFVAFERAAAGPAEPPAPVFKLAPCGTKLRPVLRSISHGLAAADGLSDETASPQARTATPEDSTPCTPRPPGSPPWLASLVDDGEDACHRPAHWDQPIPTFWTYICVRRPPEPPPEPCEAGAELQAPVSRCAPQPWRTCTKVPLPWPARSSASGGVSPLPQLRCWRHLMEAELLVDECTDRGGGLLVLAGPFGCGKTELTEHLVIRAVQGPARMQPMFGAMEVLSGQRWAAIRGVLAYALALLQPAGRLHSMQEFSKLLSLEAVSPAEEKALLQAGLVSAPEPVAVLPGNRRSGKLVNPFNDSSVDDLGSGWSSEGREAAVSEALMGMVVRLVEQLLQRSSVVVALRISQGTSLLPVDAAEFWLLASTLSALAARHGSEPGWRHSLLVLVVCRDEHLDAGIAAQHPVVHLGPLAGEEISRYIHLCLGLPEEGHAQGMPQPARSVGQKGALRGLASEEDAAPQPGEGGVPHRLVHWLRRVADLPRHLEEGLIQLRQAGIITVTGGCCMVHTDMSLLNTATWIHTHMVGRIISQMEVMPPEMQHVLQIATVLPGPFSSLDLAAAVRVHLAWGVPNMMKLCHCVRHLTACRELVRVGFLRRVGVQPGQEDDMEEEQDGELTNGNDGCLPRWDMPNCLIRHVVASTVLQGMRMELKRAIIVARAIEELRWTRRPTAGRVTNRISTVSGSSEAELCSKSLGKPPRIPKKMSPCKAPMNVNTSSSNSGYAALPSSCVVTSTLLQGASPLISQRSASEEEDSEDSEDNSVVTNLSSAKHMLYDLSGSFSLSQALRPPCHLIQQGCVFTSLMAVLLWPDLWIIAEGDQASLDWILLVAMFFFTVDILLRLIASEGYSYKSLLTDLIVLISILLDVSWAMGVSPSGILIHRKDATTVWRMIGAYVRFTACAVRLTPFIRSVAGILQSGYERRRKFRTVRVEPQVTVSRLLEDISRKLAQAILLHLVTFTILIVCSVQVVDVFTPPKEDASMHTWVTLLSQQIGNCSNLNEDLQRFREYYIDMAYGPYSIFMEDIQETPAASGSAVVPASECQKQWRSSGGMDFDDPRRRAFQFDVRSAGVQASFNFSRPAKHEALIRVAIISTAVLCMVLVSVSLDSVTTGLVVAPLARLLLTVRQVMAQLVRNFPDLEDADSGEEHDDVTAFEKMVSKITLIVTTWKQRGKINSSRACSEWISGIEGCKRANSCQGVRNVSKTFNPGPWGGRPANDIERLQQLRVSYELLHSWFFDVLSLEKPQLTGIAGWILLESANPYLAVESQVVVTFLDAMAEEYHEVNPYHNWMHACDVQHMVFRECKLGAVLDFASQVDVYALLVAAVSHDAGHPGMSNHFLVQTSHEFALRYNDISPLENMHCSTMFRVLSSKAEANIFGTLSSNQYREARLVCIETILHTDNAKHFEMVKELQMFYHTNSDVFDQLSDGFPTSEEVKLLHQEGNRRMALQALLHAADISNPCKPWGICESWAGLVLDEFFMQGDKEKELGMPVQMLNNRKMVNKPSSQVAFIEIFIYPFNIELVRIFPPLWKMSDNLLQNLQRWQALRTPEEQEKTGPKVQAICEDLTKVVQSASSQMRKSGKATSVVQLQNDVNAGTWTQRRFSLSLPPKAGALMFTSFQTQHPEGQPDPAAGLASAAQNTTAFHELPQLPHAVPPVG